MKLHLIHFLDWLDHDILDHRFHLFCRLIIESSWWGGPVNLDDLTPEQVIREVTRRFRNNAFGEKYTSKVVDKMLKKAGIDPFANFQQVSKIL